MASKPATFRQADLQRALKGFLSVGLSVASAEIQRDKIVIHTSDNGAQESPLDAWRRSDGQS